MEKIADGIFAIRTDERVCGSVYVLVDRSAGKERHLIIDAGDEKSDLETEFGAGFVPDITLLTHGHSDHTLGVKEEWKNVYLRHEDWFDNFPFHTPKNARDYDFKSMKFGKFELEIFHTPGHSPGSVCILEKTTRTLFSGDTKFAHGGVGRTDFFGGDDAAMEKSLKFIESLDYRLLCPGHDDLEM